MAPCKHGIEFQHLISIRPPLAWLDVDYPAANLFSCLYGSQQQLLLHSRAAAASTHAETGADTDDADDDVVGGAHRATKWVNGEAEAEAKTSIWVYEHCLHYILLLFYFNRSNDSKNMLVGCPPACLSG